MAALLFCRSRGFLEEDQKRRRLFWVLVTLGVLVILSCVHASSAARKRARQTRCDGNLYRIAWALNVYKERFGTFPPPVIRAADGLPRQSWRLLISPYYCGVPESLAGYDFGEAYDSETNLAFARLSKDAFRCPSDTTDVPFETSYFLVPVSQLESAGIRMHDPNADSPIDVEMMAVVECHGTGIQWLRPADIRVVKRRSGDRSHYCVRSADIDGPGIRFVNLNASVLRPLSASCVDFEIESYDDERVVVAVSTEKDFGGTSNGPAEGENPAREEP